MSTSLVEFVHSQRWFGGKSQDVIGAEIVDQAVLREEPRLADALVELRYGDGNHDLYQLLLGEDEVDVLADSSTGLELVRLVQQGVTVPTLDGQLTFESLEAMPKDRPFESVRALGLEQSNSSLVVDDSCFVKVYRRIEAGVNPDLEL